MTSINQRESALLDGMKPHIGRRRTDIDGLRAIAVLLVLAFHASPVAVPRGFIGVDVFFVISGYLITANVLRDLDAKTFSFLDFYARRCRRIIPALMVVLGVVWALGWGGLLPEEFKSLGSHLIAGATFTTNILLWKESGYFDAAAEAKPLLHLWSLGVEEQFYLLWPVVLFLLSRANAPTGGALALLILGSFSLNAIAVRHHAVAAFYLFPARFWEILVGAGLAYVQSRRMEHSAFASWQRWLENGTQPAKTMANAAAVAGVLLIVGAAFAIDGRALFPGWWAVAPVAGALLALAAGEHVSSDRAGLSSAPLVFIGLISYPLYLWHWPLMSLARIVEQGTPTRWIRVEALLLAAVLASLTWRLVERPVQERLYAFGGVNKRRRQCVVWSVAAVLVVSLLGWVTVKRDGFPDRTRLEQFSELRKAQAPLPRYPACSGYLEEGKSLSWCFTSVRGEPSIAIFGDSHAYYLFAGFADLDLRRGTNTLVIGQTACAPLSHVRSSLRGTQEACSAANDLAIRLIGASHAIQTVVLTSLGPYYFSGQSFAADYTGQNDASNWILQPLDEGSRLSGPDLFQEGLSRTVATLESSGKHVVFFIDVPELDFYPAACLDARPFRLTPRLKQPCMVTLFRVMERQATYRAIIHNIQQTHPKLRVFDPLPYLCRNGSCGVEREGRLLFRDSHHLSLFGSAFLASAFDEWFRAGN